MFSRKTGYKLLNRYREEGPLALCNCSVRYANQLPEQVERLILDTKRDKAHWGARKIRELLVRRLAGDVRVPATSTIHAVMDRHGLVRRRGWRRRNKAQGTPLSAGLYPNDLWCTDFKGEFKLGNRRILLSAHRHRSRLAPYHDVRSLGLNPRGARDRHLRAPVRRARTAMRHPKR